MDLDLPPHVGAEQVFDLAHLRCAPGWATSASNAGHSGCNHTAQRYEVKRARPANRELQKGDPRTSVPSRAAAATVSSSCMAPMAPTAAAQASGCPL